MLDKENYQAPDIKHVLEKSVERDSVQAVFWVKRNEDSTYRSITCKEAHDDICGLADSLASLGMKEKKVAVVGGGSYEWAVSYFGAMHGAGAALILDGEFCITELKYFLNVTECSCAIFPGELEDVFLQIMNDGVTGLEILINMDNGTGEWNVFSLRALIDDGKRTKNL